MRVFAAGVLMLLVTPAGFPQNKLVEIIEVRVVNIDVVVRDRAGNPVRGLGKEDFELYEDGVKQTISNLYEVRREDAAAATSDAQIEIPLELRQRRLLLFVDSASIQSSRKQAVLDAVDKFVDQKMRPEDQAMVVSWRLGLHIISPFTNDKAAVRRAVDALRHIAQAGEAQQNAVSAAKRDIQWQVRLAEDSAISWAEAYANARALTDRYAHRLTVQQE